MEQATSSEPTANKQFRAYVTQQISSIPTASPTCANFAEQQDVEEDHDYHTNVNIYCPHCKSFFCENCHSLCVYSSLESNSKIPMSKKKTVQAEHLKHQWNINEDYQQNIQQDVMQLFIVTNNLVSMIQRWTNDTTNVNLQDIIDQYELFKTATSKHIITPYFNRTFLEPLTPICEKISIFHKAQEQVNKFSEMFKKYNNKALDIMDSFTLASTEMRSFCKSYLKISNDKMEEYLSLANTAEKLKWNAINSKNPMKCCVVGITNSGKTTLMNAILGMNLLPSKEGRCTIANTELRYADYDKRKIEIKEEHGTFNTLSQFTSEYLMQHESIPEEVVSTFGVSEKTKSEQKKDRESQKTIRVHWDSLLLKTGIAFSDTPGYDDIYEEEVLFNTYKRQSKKKALPKNVMVNPQTLEFIQESELVILVVDINHTYTSKDAVLNLLDIDELKGKQIMVVMNKCNMFGSIGKREDRGWESFIHYCEEYENTKTASSPPLLLQFYKMVNNTHEKARTTFEACLLNHIDMMSTKGISVNQIYPLSAMESLCCKVEGTELDLPFTLFEKALFNIMEDITKKRMSNFASVAHFSVNTFLRSTLLCKNWHVKMYQMQLEKKKQLEDISSLVEKFRERIQQIIQDLRQDIIEVFERTSSQSSSKKIEEAMHIIHTKVSVEFKEFLKERIAQDPKLSVSDWAYIISITIFAIPISIILLGIAVLLVPVLMPIMFPYVMVKTILDMVTDLKKKKKSNIIDELVYKSERIQVSEEESDSAENDTDDVPEVLSTTLLALDSQNLDVNQVIQKIMQSYPDMFCLEIEKHLISKVENEYNDKLKTFNFVLCKDGKELAFFNAWKEFQKDQNGCEQLYNYYCKTSSLFFDINTKFSLSNLKSFEFCGHGAFGKTYRLNNITAIKYISTIKLAEHILDRELFYNSQLSHAHIVKSMLIKKEETENALNGYIYQEYLPQTLSQWALNKPINYKKALRYACEIALGMKYIQSCNIMHRDLDKSNIMIDKFDHIKIIDLGVAKEMVDNAHTANQGKYKTMAPEVKRSGSDFAIYDFRCDVYSFGIVVKELLDGYDSSEISLLLERCLEKDFKNRIGDWNEIIFTLYKSYEMYELDVEPTEYSNQLKIEVQEVQEESQIDIEVLKKELKDKKIIPKNCIVQ
ncbi:predicted protein [Naegleria gruberi]|uniref:Predicted protein n=1 Tax=Naegleria gruberi TaxID=5762 RepID=D2W2Z3_NAEGR|nr:uncharacterized protein NAEGRDRAFT_82185 [Naegleria gruberi]EFC36491.1 predicted protein [Naegleria gruberi]|eukprot:XP_002669235.1 predicted protein [Naegleria gruberi strain NEG-M]